MCGGLLLIFVTTNFNFFQTNIRGRLFAERDRGREPGRVGAGGGREAAGNGAGCGNHVRVGRGRMRDIKIFNDFSVTLKQTIKIQN